MVRDGAVARALELLAGLGTVPDGGGAKIEARRKTLAPLATAEGWGPAGMDPALGGAVFLWPLPERGALFVLPVRDRARFRETFHLRMGVQSGRDVEVLGSGYVCAPAGGRYLCALSLDDIDGAAAPHPAALAHAVEKLPAGDRGDVEVYASPRMREVAHLREQLRPLGLLTGVAGTVSFRPDGASARVHVIGETVSPQALGLAGAPPPAAFAPAAAGAPTTARVHVDLAAVIPPTANIDAQTRTELVDQLTGDAEIATSGTGVAGLSLTAPLKDAARVERWLKARCAETGGTQRRYAIGRITVRDHGCTAAFIPALLLLPVSLTSIDLSATVEGQRLVVLVGDAREPSPRQREWTSLVDGDAARQALGDAEALVAFTRSPTVGPEVAPAKAWKALVPFLDEKTMGMIDAWNEVAARLYQISMAARVEPDGVVASIDLTTFAADAPEARAAYEAALARRTAGDEAGYRGALQAIEARFPGTRAARRAAEVREGAPYVGTGAFLLGALSRLGQKK